MGYFGRIIEVGYYDIAQQITRIEITLNSTLTNIMIPRVTKLFSENKIEEIKEELADVVNYCVLMADACGLDLDEIVQTKIEKNNEKYPVEKSKGKSDKYDKL